MNEIIKFGQIYNKKGGHFSKGSSFKEEFIAGNSKIMISLHISINRQKKSAALCIKAYLVEF